MHEDQIHQLRQKAEHAVIDMDDAQLKVAAFKVILGHLLATASAAAEMAIVRPRRNESLEEDRPQIPATATARIRLLIEQNFFSTQRSISDVREELARHGWHYPVTNLSGKLQALAGSREIRRMKVVEGNRTIWKYSGS